MVVHTSTWQLSVTSTSMCFSISWAPLTPYRVGTSTGLFSQRETGGLVSEVICSKPQTCLGPKPGPPHTYTGSVTLGMSFQGHSPS